MSNPLSTLCVLLFLSILSGRTLGLGINCRGSDLCPHATWNNQASESVIRVLRDAVWDSTLDNSTRYRNGDHIICVSQTQNVTLSGIPYGSAGTTFDLNSNFGIGGICLFPQDCTLTLKQIRPLTNALLAHGCTICGSVPIHFIDEGSNDPGEGILSFNYQANPVCDGNCITGSGQTNASIITSSTISPDAASAAASTTASILPSDASVVPAETTTTEASSPSGTSSTFTTGTTVPTSTISGSATASVSTTSDAQDCLSPIFLLTVCFMVCLI